MNSSSRPRTPGIMQSVLLATAPGAIVLCHVFGWGVVLNLLLAVASAVATEILCLRWRARDPVPALQDGSALLTGLLIGLALPSLAPAWLVVIASRWK